MPSLIRLGVIRDGYVILRTGEIIRLGKYNWDLYLFRRNLMVNKGVVTYSLSNGYLARLSFADLWAPNLDLLNAVINEDLISIYPKEYFNDKVVIDVGAYIGDTTVLFSKCYGAKKVIALEPNPIHYKALLINLRLNKLTNVKVMNKALCSKVGSKACIEGLGHSARTKELINNDECSSVVDCIGLNELITTYSPDTVKIDCEGCEYDVILNMELKTLKQVSTYIIEFHSKYVEERIINYLRSLGYNKIKTTQEVKSSDIYASVAVFKRIQ